MRAVILALLVPTFAYTASYFLYNQSARVNAIGLAGVAVKGPEAVFYNPSLMEEGSLFGFSFYKTYLKFKGMGVEDRSVSPDVLTPFGYGVGRLGDFRIGIGFNSPFGLLTKWSDDWLGSSLSTEGALSTQFFYFSISRDLGAFKLGISPFLVFSSSKMRRVTSGNKVKIEGEGRELGLKIGASYVGKRVVLGAIYQSTVTLEMDGHMDVNGFRVSETSIKLRLPGYVGFGIALRLTDSLNLYASLLRMFWSDADSVKASFPYLSPMVLKKNAHDSEIVSFGISFKTDKLTFMGGVSFDESPYPEEAADPILPDNDRVLYTFGVSYRNLTAAYQRTVFHRANSRGPLPGTYKMSADVFLLTFTLKP